jgi:hypothetical protein
MTKPKLEVADVFRSLDASFVAALPAAHRRVVQDMMACRTAALRTDRVRIGCPLFHQTLGEEAFQEHREAGSGSHGCTSHRCSRRLTASPISSGQPVRYQ